MRINPAIWACYACAFLSNAGFAIVIPSLSYFLKQLGYVHRLWVGLAISLFSFGQAIGAPIFGWLSDNYDIRFVLATSLVSTIAGDMLYALSDRIWMLLLARFLTGFGAGNQAVIQSYVLGHTPLERRSEKARHLSTLFTLSNIAGPAIGAGLSFLDFELVPNYRFNICTAPGYVSGVFGLVDFFLVLLLIKPRASPNPDRPNFGSINDFRHASRGYNQRIATKETPVVTQKDAYDDEFGDETVSLIRDVSEPNPTASVDTMIYFTQLEHNQSLKRALPIIVILMFTNFAIVTSGAVFETILTPLTQDDFGWGVTASFIQWTVTGCVSIVSFLFQILLSRRLNDHIMLATGVVFLATGWATLIVTSPDKGPPIARFVPGAVFIALGWPWAMGYCIALYSKIIGGVFQGKLLGYLAASGALARLSAPIWSTVLYDHSRGLVIFPIASGLLFVAAFLVIVSKRAGSYLAWINSVPSSKYMG